MQTRTQSAIEAMTNAAVAYCISLAATAVILPAFGYRLTVGDTFGISASFTAISLVRSYAIRRFFNQAQKRS